MKQKKAYTIHDVGPGDGGKGGVNHAIAFSQKVHTVIQNGGFQGGHGVHTSRGQRFSFSTFGCGTFEGIKTHVTGMAVIEPYLFLHEADTLRNAWGIKNIFDLITVDENTLSATPLHMLASRFEELKRGSNPRGTVGTGAGTAMRDAEMHPDTAIRARDFGKPILREKLQAIRSRMVNRFSDILEDPDAFLRMILPEDRDQAQFLIGRLNDESFINLILERFQVLSGSLRVVDAEFLKRDILSRDGVVLVEGSHGVLNDRLYGFHPHTTARRVVPGETLRFFDECGYDGEIIPIGVMRAYAIRHGAGPMVTEDPAMLDTLLPGSHKDDNRWQGKVRVGPLDLVSLRYAINVCGGAEFFRGLAVTWFDQIKANGIWNMCDRYIGAHDEQFFSSDGEMKVHHGSGEEQLEHQRAFGEALAKCRPEITSIPVSGKSDDELVSLCAETLEEKTGIPVALISIGPTEKDKVYL